MNLVYRPIIKSVPVSNSLKKVLLARLWPKENFLTPVEIDQNWVGYFQGLKDSGYDEAELLIDALKAHQSLYFTLEG